VPALTAKERMLQEHKEGEVNRGDVATVAAWTRRVNAGIQAMMPIPVALWSMIVI
jgi:hypothetical protein